MYSWTLLLPAGPLYTGLTDLRAQLASVVDGSSIGSAIGDGFVEVGSNGDYLFTYAEYPSDQTVGVIFYSNAAPLVTLGSVVMNPAEVAYGHYLPAIRASTVGRSFANDPILPTEIEYYDEDDTTVLFTHTITRTSTDVERTVA